MIPEENTNNKNKRSEDNDNYLKKEKKKKKLDNFTGSIAHGRIQHRFTSKEEEYMKNLQFLFALYGAIDVTDKEKGCTESNCPEHKEESVADACHVAEEE